MNRVAVEVNYLDELGAAKQALFATIPLVKDGSNFFTSFPGSDLIFEPRIAENPRLRQQVESGVCDATGVLELKNADHALDAYFQYSFEGQLIRFVVELETGPGTFNAFFIHGYMEQPEFTDRGVLLKYQSVGTAKLARPWRFGTFSGGGGLNGGSDIVGKVRPQLWGKARHISPVLVDPANLIYQVSDAHYVFGASSSVTAVYDAGVALTAGATYASTADLLANAPAAGQYRVLNASGMGQGIWVRLGSSPVGVITADAQYDVTGGAGSLKYGDQLNAMLSWAISGSIDGGTQGLLNALASSEPWGMYLTEPRSARDVIVDALAGVAGWISPRYDSAGATFSVRFPTDPSTLTNSSVPGLPDIPGDTIIRSGRSSTVPEPFTGLPAIAAIVNYERVWTVQTSGLAGSVSATTRSYLANEYRSERQSASGTIQVRYPNGPEVTHDAFWVPAAVASITTEAQRLRDALCARRDLLQIRCQVADLLPWTRIGLGDPVNVVSYPRYGCDVSRKFMAIGYDLDLVTGVGDIILWG